MTKSPNCRACKHSRRLPGDCHLMCVPPKGVITQKNPHGVRNGWCFWPLNFDPIWIEACNSFEAKN